MIPVVIGTNPERRAWLNDCLKSIRATSRYRRVLIHDAGGYELSALRTGIAHFKRFLYLHDSCEVLHPDFWGIVDSGPSTWLFGGPPMYLAVYDTDRLAPAIDDAPYGYDITKRTSIDWEGELPKRLPYPTIWPEVTDATGYMETRHGRPNLVLENRYLRKWKGTWG